jgi:hypothetical protein
MKQKVIVVVLCVCASAFSGCLQANVIAPKKTFSRSAERNAAGALSDADVGAEFLADVPSNVRQEFIEEGVGGNSLRVFRRQGSRPYWLAVAELRRASVEVRLPAVRSKLARTSVTGGDCTVAINGGYFGGTGSASLAIDNGVVLSRDAQGLSRKQGLAFPARAVLSMDVSRDPRLIWGKMGASGLQFFAEPPNPFVSGASAPTGAEIVTKTAIGGGPMLVWNSQLRVSTSEEAIDPSVQPESRAPRTALAITSNGRLLALVADGRSEITGGFSLNELASELVSLGANSAMNLDGGGSSTFVVNGVVKNRPSDGSERAVSSIVCLKI